MRESPPRLSLFLPLGLAAGLAAAAGCTHVPELDAAVPDWVQAADYPALLPLEGELAVPPTPGEDGRLIAERLAARRDSLQRRARGMSAEVLDPQTRKRMHDGVAR